MIILMGVQREAICLPWIAGHTLLNLLIILNDYEANQEALTNLIKIHYNIKFYIVGSLAVVFSIHDSPRAN